MASVQILIRNSTVSELDVRLKLPKVKQHLSKISFNEVIVNLGFWTGRILLHVLSGACNE